VAKAKLKPPRQAQLLAILALIFLAAALAAAIYAAIDRFPLDLVAVLLVAGSVVVGLRAILQAGVARAFGLFASALLAAGAFLVLLATLKPVADALTIASLVLGLALTRKALRYRLDLPAEEAPERPVVFWNPKSGGGKAAQARLDAEARARGITPVELRPGGDLEALVREAVAGGADALAAAGGDGTQATVAALAAEAGLPFACIPAGTRNHFALDLGVDRDDLIGALDAFVDGGEKRVDLGEVNGRVFVNNVSLGLYAEAVQSDDYRRAKIRTLVGTAAEIAEDGGLDLPSPDGHDGGEPLAILISNNQYRVGRAIGSGMRPRIDDGLLGVTVFEQIGPVTGGALTRTPWRQWETPELTLDPGEAVAAGIDGEATELQSPIRFAIRPAALRVRIARAHPGASPAARLPERFTGIPKALWQAATGRG
jgi:diacylglycerol kinase family enzyme